MDFPRIPYSNRHSYSRPTNHNSNGEILWLDINVKVEPLSLKDELSIGFVLYFLYD